MTRRRALATQRRLPPVRLTWRHPPASRAVDATYATDPHKRVIHGESAFGHFVGGADCAGYRRRRQQADHRPLSTPEAELCPATKPTTVSRQLEVAGQRLGAGWGGP
jgi:hypothetical protein